MRWVDAVAHAKKDLGLVGFHKAKKGSALYKRAKHYMDSSPAKAKPQASPRAMPWIEALGHAKRRLGLTGFVAPKKGTELHNLARRIQREGDSAAKPKHSPRGKPKHSPRGKPKHSPRGKKKHSPPGKQHSPNHWLHDLIKKHKPKPRGKKQHSPRGKKRHSPRGKKRKHSPPRGKKHSPRPRKHGSAAAIPWVQAVSQAKRDLGLTGFVAPKKGTDLYKLARKYQQQDVKNPNVAAVKSPKVAARAQVWIGENGDIRQTRDGPLIDWATKDGSMFGEFLKFIPDRMQPDPRSPSKRGHQAVLVTG